MPTYEPWFAGVRTFPIIVLSAYLSGSDEQGGIQETRSPPA